MLAFLLQFLAQLFLGVYISSCEWYQGPFFQSVALTFNNVTIHLVNFFFFFGICSYGRAKQRYSKNGKEKLNPGHHLASSAEAGALVSALLPFLSLGKAEVQSISPRIDGNTDNVKSQKDVYKRSEAKLEKRRRDT